jgi:hypothetical protein
LTLREVIAFPKTAKAIDLIVDVQIRLRRVVSMEAERFPKLARRFYELGPKRNLEELSRYFHEQIERRRLLVEYPAKLCRLRSAHGKCHSILA